MVDSGTILVTVFENFAKLIPRRIIQENERGIKWNRGVAKRELSEGIYWFVPFFQSIDIENVTNRVADTERQDIPLRDDTIVNVKTSMTYSISDIMKYYLNLYEHGPSILNLAELAVYKEISPLTWEELKTKQVREKGQQSSDLEKALLGNLKKSASEYGITASSIGLISLTPSKRTYRLITNSQSEIRS